MLDVSSPRAVVSDRKSCPLPLDVVLNLHKKVPRLTQYFASLASRIFESDGDNQSNRLVAHGKANSKVNGVDSDSDQEGNGNGNGFDEEGEEFDWEKEMRKRVKEIEEMKELEMKAEVFLSRTDDCEVTEETDEEKRMRVSKELEKVYIPSVSFHFLCCGRWSCD